MNFSSLNTNWAYYELTQNCVYLFIYFRCFIHNSKRKDQTTCVRRHKFSTSIGAFPKSPQFKTENNYECVYCLHDKYWHKIWHPVCRDIYIHVVKLFDIKMWLKEITFACFFLLCKWRTSDLLQRRQSTSTLLTHNNEINSVAMEPKVRNFYCFFSIALITASVLKEPMYLSLNSFIIMSYMADN